VAQSGQRLDDEGEKMGRTKKTERNDSAMEAIEVEAIH
jgi:hypothetical protein